MRSLELFASEVMPHFADGQRATINDAFSEEELLELQAADSEALQRVQSGVLI